MNPDWKELLMKVLDCFGTEEGTWYQRQWKHYGISDEEACLIDDAWAEFKEDTSD